MPEGAVLKKKNKIGSCWKKTFERYFESSSYYDLIENIIFF